MIIKDGTNESNLTSFLLIGQSNMAGRGDFGEVAPIINPNCFMLRMGRWQPMSEPINPDRAIFDTLYHSGVCLAASFADSLAKHTNSKIGLIPCADGGTQISQWMPGEVLFDHAVMMTRLAMRTSTLGGILWHQGESDCHPPKFYEHKKKLIHMLTEFRRQVGAEHLPLLIGELSYNIDPKWSCHNLASKMNETFYDVANILPNCVVVSAAGLTMKPDGIHFDSKSLREFGNRYFEKYIEMTENSASI